MPVRTLILAIAACLLAAGADAPTPPPAPSTKMLAMSAAPDAATQQALDAFVAFHFKQIQEGDAEAVKDARAALSATLTRSEVTPLFQQAFLASAKPKVAAVVDGKDAFRIANALTVLRQLRSTEAFELVLAQANPATQKDERVRVSSASMLPVMVARGAVPAAQLDAVSRKVADALETETSWLAACEDFECLARMVAEAGRAKLPAQAANVRGEMVKAAVALQEGIDKGGDVRMAGALVRGLVSLRDQVLKLPENERASLKQPMEGMLRAVSRLPDPPNGRDAATQREIDSARKLADAIASLLKIDLKAPAKS